MFDLQRGEFCRIIREGLQNETIMSLYSRNILLFAAIRTTIMDGKLDTVFSDLAVKSALVDAELAGGHQAEV